MQGVLDVAQEFNFKFKDAPSLDQILLQKGIMDKADLDRLSHTSRNWNTELAAVKKERKKIKAKAKKNSKIKKTNVHAMLRR